MNKVCLLLLFLFIGNLSDLLGQNTSNILMKHRWSIYDNFAIIDFFENGEAEIHYAYCTYCQANQEKLSWKMTNNELILGKDTLVIKQATAQRIQLKKGDHTFFLKDIQLLKTSKLKKQTIQQFLVAKPKLQFRLSDLSNTYTNEVQFADNGKMWLDQPHFRGQWALKSFYGDLFLIYIHRNTINRDFPILKITNFKKGKLSAKAIPLFNVPQPTTVTIKK